MSSRFEISEILSTIDNLLENREPHQKDADLAIKFVEKLKKMEVWFICKVYFDNSEFLHKVVDLCQNGPQHNIRKFMAFAIYCFGELGPERFEDCINRSSLPSRGKRTIIGCFKRGEVDHALVHDISIAAGAGLKVKSIAHFSPEESANDGHSELQGMHDESNVYAF